MDYRTSTGRETIPHYHGDTVRLLFVATVFFTFLIIPFLGHVLPFGTVFEVIAGIILILLAGLMNPHSRWVMVLSVLAAALGAVLLEGSAIAFHAKDNLSLLIAREAGALAFVVALYLAVKTLRAMNQKKVGELPRPWEFEQSETNNEA